MPKFKKWNFVDTEELAELKMGLIAHEGYFRRIIEENFTLYHR